MIVYDPKRCRWETYQPEVFKAFIDIREKIKATMLITSYFIEETRERPTTHYTHDRFIARLEKLARILEEIYILEHTDTEIRPIFLFRRQSENLRNFARILKAYKDEVKRKRLYILEFIYPHLHKTLLDVLMLRIMWKLKGTYYNKAHIVYEIYCNEFSHEVREWVSFHISTEKSYYTRSIPFFTLENILKKAIKRRENRRWTYEYPISIKGLFEVV